MSAWNIIQYTFFSKRFSSDILKPCGQLFPASWRPATVLCAILIIAAAPLLFAAPAARIDWCTNYEDALAKSKSSQKNIFVFFNGSDWCRPAVRFKRSILESQELHSKIGGDFVFLEIDHVSTPSDAEKANHKKNEKLKFTVGNYPTVLLVDPEGHVYGRIQSGKDIYPARFLAKVKLLQDARITRDAEWAKAGKLNGPQKALYLGKGLEALEEFVARQCKPVLDEIKKSDPEDTTGYTRRYEFNAGHFIESKLWKPVNEKKYDEAVAVVDEQLKNSKWTATQRQQLLGGKFYVYNKWDKKDEAVAILNKIIEMDPQSEMSLGAKNYIDYLLKPVQICKAWDPTVCRDPGTWESDATTDIKSTGTYTVAFEHLEANDLRIDEVALVSGSTEIAVDKHEGWAKPEPKNNIYTLKVDNIPAGTKLTLRMVTRCGGWRESWGRIVIKKSA